MTAENIPPSTQPDTEQVSWRELARRKGVKPVMSLSDMARPDLFESDEELDDFLAFVAAQRRADLA